MISSSKYDIEIFKTEDLLNKAAAKFIIDIALDSIAARGLFVISLSGGETPKKLYALLSQPPFRHQLPWKKTYVFWGDERCVPLDDKRNNAYQAKTILLDKTNIPISNIFQIPVNLPPEEAALKYEKEIMDFFGNEPPRFDLMLLGLGENGHTASLFPGTKVLEETAMGVREVDMDETPKGSSSGQKKQFRITMTAPLINESHNILFLVTGGDKAEILENVLNGMYQPDKYPAQLIHARDGAMYWFIDWAAASLINA